MGAVDESGDAAPMRPGLSPQLEQLRERIAAARSRDHTSVETTILLQDLETAHEELRVADEEALSVRGIRRLSWTPKQPSIRNLPAGHFRTSSFR